MPIATSSEKINLSSEKKTEELADKLIKKNKARGCSLFAWRNWSWQDYLHKIFYQRT